ncbi:MAG: methyltransferase domain-containing protein [Acidobacteria bacterium]|nr:methyltransferase domain-containing protein [Acidobacteriota bacterium]
MTGPDRVGAPPADSPDVRRFYDRYVEAHVPYHRCPQGWQAAVLRALPYWSYREWRFWRRAVPAGCRLLDLGSARGREIFRRRAAWAIGIDLASAALVECAEHYDGALLGSLAALPFADESFDCVVSSHVLGHTPFAIKPAVHAEIERVLRPGGRTVHVIEVDGAHPLVELSKQDPELYRRRIIDPDGHVGLDAPRAALDRFCDAGLEYVEATPWENGPIHPRLAVKWFDNEHRDRDPRFAELVRCSRDLLASPARLALAEVALGCWGAWFGPRRGLDEALFLAAVFRKP